MMKNRIAELIFCNDRFRIISHYLLPPTVVKHPDFYYHLTTIDGIDLPHFAVFRMSHDIVTPISGQRYACKWAAKRDRIRLFRRLNAFDKNTFCVPRQYTIKTRKLLIFKDFLGLLRAIYYPFTTFENQKN